MQSTSSRMFHSRFEIPGPGMKNEVRFVKGVGQLVSQIPVLHADILLFCERRRLSRETLANERDDTRTILFGPSGLRLSALLSYILSRFVALDRDRLRRTTPEEYVGIFIFIPFMQTP